jgi:hypothetical protein
MIILYQITQLSEQKYRLAIPFAENNFGPFEHIVFVMVLFEYPSKTLLRVLFASLYLQICMFYQYISFLVQLWARSELIPTGNTTENRQNNATFVSYDLASVTQTVFRSPETKHSLRTRETILFQWRNAFIYKRPMKFLVFKQPHTVCLFCVDISWA